MSASYFSLSIFLSNYQSLRKVHHWDKFPWLLLNLCVCVRSFDSWPLKPSDCAARNSQERGIHPTFLWRSLYLLSPCKIKCGFGNQMDWELPMAMETCRFNSHSPTNAVRYWLLPTHSYKKSSSPHNRITSDIVILP